MPLRMNIQGGAGNVLLAGKNMAQTFHANGATRLHPSEWTSGVAAGGMASLMVLRGWSTADLVNNAQVVRAWLNSSAIGQPLDWAHLPTPQPAPDTYLCAAFGAQTRCLNTDQAHIPSGNPTVYNTSTCNSACSPMAADEWIANDQYWSQPSATNRISALQDTKLKKSFADSQVLPPEDVLPVSQGTPCKLVSAVENQDYWLCSIN